MEERLWFLILVGGWTVQKRILSLNGNALQLKFYHMKFKYSLCRCVWRNWRLECPRETKKGAGVI